MHAAALAALHEAAFPDDPWDGASFVSLLSQPGVVGLLDERGFVLLRVVADEAEILTIVVMERRRGVGRALMLAAMACAAARKVAKIYLEVAAGNVAALGLYAGLGFVQVGRRAGYYADGGDALVLRLEVVDQG